MTRAFYIIPSVTTKKISKESAQQELRGIKMCHCKLSTKHKGRLKVGSEVHELSDIQKTSRSCARCSYHSVKRSLLFFHPTFSLSWVFYRQDRAIGSLGGFHVFLYNADAFLSLLC